MEARGYFADNVRCLEEAVQNEDSVVFGEIEEIRGTYLSYRFCGVGEAPYNLFYLIEEPKKKKEVTLTEAEADSIITLLREIQGYLKKQFDETEKKGISLKDDLARQDRQGILTNFIESLYDNILKEGRIAFNIIRKIKGLRMRYYYFNKVEKKNE